MDPAKFPTGGSACSALGRLISGHSILPDVPLFLRGRVDSALLFLSNTRETSNYLAVLASRFATARLGLVKMRLASTITTPDPLAGGNGG